MKSYRNHTDAELLRACYAGNVMEAAQAHELRDRLGAAVDRANEAERKLETAEALIASIRHILNG